MEQDREETLILVRVEVTVDIWLLLVQQNLNENYIMNFGEDSFLKIYI